MRIAIAGFQHETNTFVAEPTDMAAFEQADSWPALLRGEEVIQNTLGMNLPIAGFVAAAGQDPSVTLLPILWCAAEPGGRVTDHAYGDISARILRTLARIGPVDAVYLDLHGAMVTDSLDDGEGDLLERIRRLIGPDVPLVASLDLHANLTARMVRAADLLTVYRSYPHLDMAETGARAFARLAAIAAHGPPAKAWRQGSYLIPLHAQHTGADPARALYAGLSEFDAPGGRLAELALGFTAADIPDMGPSVLAYGPSQAEADRSADLLAWRLRQAEAAFDVALLEPDAAVADAIGASRAGPVVIADVQDNPGAGASSDTTGLLRALLKAEAPGAILGLIHDPALATRAHRAGEGAAFSAPIGGRGPGDTPLTAGLRVERLSDGQCRYTGRMYGGGIATLGLSAGLRLTDADIRIVVTSIRNQCLDLAHFRHFGLEPAAARIVCVKSTAHFRADFEPLARKVLMTAAPGQFPCGLGDIAYRKLRAGVRRGPGGPVSGPP